MYEFKIMEKTLKYVYELLKILVQFLIKDEAIMLFLNKK